MKKSRRRIRRRNEKGTTKLKMKRGERKEVTNETGGKRSLNRERGKQSLGLRRDDDLTREGERDRSTLNILLLAFFPLPFVDFVTPPSVGKFVGQGE